MKFIFYSMSFLLLFSCNNKQTIEPGKYHLYDTLADTSFFAIEFLNRDGTGEFKEFNLYKGDTCQISSITFNWKTINNLIIYENQRYSKIIDCKNPKGYEDIEPQHYEITKLMDNTFIAKTYYNDKLSPLDSSIVLWKKVN